MSMTIGEASKRSRCSPATIRYYESIGLLAPAARTVKGRRTFGFPDVSRLNFIRRCREVGLSLDAIQELLGAADERDGKCALARSLVSTHLQTVRARLADFALLEASLSRMVTRCDEGCAKSDGEECTIFADIAADL